MKTASQVLEIIQATLKEHNCTLKAFEIQKSLITERITMLHDGTILTSADGEGEGSIFTINFVYKTPSKPFPLGFSTILPEVSIDEFLKVRIEEAILWVQLTHLEVN